MFKTRIAVIVTIASCARAQSETGTRVPIHVAGIPGNAPRVIVLAESDSLRIPLTSVIDVPAGSLTAVLSILKSSDEDLRIRAVAFSGATRFPIVTAIGTAAARNGFSGSVPLALAWPKPQIIELDSASDGTIRLQANFGGGTFFRLGDVAELWISPHRPAFNCGGDHFIAPLRLEAGIWRALFSIPVDLSTSGIFLQIAFHALAFQQDGQIPLLVWPNVDRGDPPLSITRYSAVAK